MIPKEGHMDRCRKLILFALTPLLLGEAEDVQRFEKKVRPMLAARCGECHGAKKTSGFSVATMQSVVAGGNKYGRAVVEGNQDQRNLIEMQRGELQLSMPLGQTMP